MTTPEQKPLTQGELREVRATLGELRSLKRLVLAVLAVVVVVGGVSTVTNLIRTGDVSNNTDAIGRLERHDRDALRSAAFRICYRQQLERAEIHAAYATPIVVPPDADPIIATLLNGAETQRRVSLARVRRNLPILDCSPNLHGKQAQPVTITDQQSFVARYLAGLLDPSPAGDTNLTPRERHKQQQIDRLSNPQPRKPKRRPSQHGGGGGGSPRPRPAPRPAPSPTPSPKPSPTTPKPKPKPDKPTGLLPQAQDTIDGLKPTVDCTLKLQLVCP